MTKLIRCQLSLLTGVLIFLTGNALVACPDTVLVIRHGEKPPLAGNPPQVPPGLSQLGQARAAALVTLFSNPGSQGFSFSKPSFIYAVTDPSGRPEQTCTPTATALNLKLNTKFDLKQEANGKMALSMLTQKGTGLTCLEHKRIPDFVSALTDNQVDLGKWNGDVFDRILIFQFQNVDGKCVFQSYQDVSQNLALPGFTGGTETSCCDK